MALGIAVIASKEEGAVTAQWGTYAVTAPAADNAARLVMARRVVTLMAAMIGLVIKRAAPPAE